MRNRLIPLVCLLLAGVFTACSSDDKSELMPSKPSKVKLIVSGDLNHSRVNDATWENGDAIGVSSVPSAKSDANYNVKYVTESGNGEFATDEDIFLNDGEEKEFIAYYPYSENVNENIIKFTKPSIFMFASAEKVTHSSPEANFTFTHSMVKITFEIKDRSTTKQNPKLSFGGNIKVEGVSTEGEFNTKSGIVTAKNDDGTVEGPFTTTGRSSFIVAPSAAKKITVYVDYADREYKATADFPQLDAGNNYTFTVNIPYPLESQNLSISATSINPWEDKEGGDIDMEGGDDNTGNNGDDDNTGETTTANVGDFLLKDGSILSPSSASSDNEDIVGVVFYVGDSHPSVLYTGICPEVKDILLRDAPGATHGLAVSIDNVNSEEMGFVTNNDIGTIGTKPENSSIFTDGMVINPAETPSVMSGYSYTKFLSNWATTTSSSSIRIKTFFNHLAEYNANNSVDNASEWYVPSFPELTLIYNNIEKINESLSIINKAIQPLEKNIVSIEGESYDYSPYYISCNMALAGTSSSSDRFLFTHTINPQYIQTTTDANHDNGWLRAVIAF